MGRTRMINTRPFCALLALATGMSGAPLLSAQSPSAVLARPGSGVVSGLTVAPSRREFAISSPCGGGNQGLVVEQIVLRGDTEVLLIQELHYSDQPKAVFDTTALDRRTLAPIWERRYLGQDTAASWDFRGLRVSGFSRQPNAQRRYLDSTLHDPAFLAGTTYLLLQATPRLYVPNLEVTFSTFDFNQETGKPSALSLYADSARVTGSETMRLPTGKRVDAWVVAVGEPPDVVTYWVEKGSREVLSWYLPYHECPMKYVRTSP